MMRPPEPRILSRLGRGDRVAIVAGGGALPGEVAGALAEAGHRPFIIIAGGEGNASASGLTDFDHRVLELEEFGRLVPVLREAGATHVVLAGTIGRRPSLMRLKWNASLLAILPRVVAALVRGDDGILRAIVGYLEEKGFRIVGAHEVLPDLLAPERALTRVTPTVAERRNIDVGFAAARLIGTLDIGQAVVAVGGRVIAVEGIEGTDGLLERVRDLRSHGRIAATGGGVLVKCAKPGQELRADLPAIGVDTVEAAHAAGLAGIAVEAGRSLILHQGALVERADRLGLFVVGIRMDAP